MYCNPYNCNMEETTLKESIANHLTLPYLLGCQKNEHQPSGTIEAGTEELTSQSRYCSWLITSEANSSVLLSFSSFEFSGNPSLNFVIVYDGKNENGALLGNFSANNLPSQEELNTNSSWMFIVHRCFMEGSEHCSFQATYVTARYPTGW